MAPSTLNILSTLPCYSGLREVDLSFGCPGQDLRYLEGLRRLERLLLDNCMLADGFVAPKSDTVTTLSLNKNRLEDLAGLLAQLSRRLRRLRHLSLMGNPFSPDRDPAAGSDSQSREQLMKR